MARGNRLVSLVTLQAEIVAIEAKLDDGTTGLDALKALIDAVEAKLDAKIYTEDSVSGTTVNAYADALDVDTRGAISLTAVILNTDGANSLDYKVLARHADYAGGADEEVQAELTLTFGTKGLIQLIHGYSRVKIQVKSTLADTPATYTVKYLINR